MTENPPGFLGGWGGAGAAEARTWEGPAGRIEEMQVLELTRVPTCVHLVNTIKQACMLPSHRLRHVLC